MAASAITRSWKCHESVQFGRSRGRDPVAVADALGLTKSTSYGWLAGTRGWPGIPEGHADAGPPARAEGAADGSAADVDPSAQSPKDPHEPDEESGLPLTLSCERSRWRLARFDDPTRRCPSCSACVASGQETAGIIESALRHRWQQKEFVPEHLAQLRERRRNAPCTTSHVPASLIAGG